MLDQQTLRVHQLSAEIRELTTMKSAQEPDSRGWDALSAKLAERNAEWLAWQAEGPALALADRQLQAARSRESRAANAGSVWPTVAGVSGAMALLLGIDWYLWAGAVPWMSRAILALVANAAGSVVLTAVSRRRNAAELADARDARRARQAERQKIIDRYNHATRSPDPAPAPAYAVATAGSADDDES